MAEVKILDKVFATSISEEKLLSAIDTAAQKINTDLDGRNPLFLCILNGAFMFAADLMKRISIPCQISFVKIASYQGTQTTGKVKSLIGLNEDLTGRTVVLLEDIVDTGITMKALVEQVRTAGANDVRIATMLFKPEACCPEVKPDYIGLNIPNDFIVGHGLDYDGYGRNLRDIYTLKQ